MPFLIVQQNDRDLQWLELGSRPVTIGRDPANRVCLECPMVSRRHAVINYTGNRHVISDLNSRYGTLLNGERTKRHQLSDGDRLQLGSCLLFFAGLAGAAAQPRMGSTTNLGGSRITPGMRSIVGLKEQVLQLDDKDRVVYLNSSVARGLGRERKALLGQPLAAIDEFPWGPGVLGSLLKEARASGAAVENIREYHDQEEGKDVALRVRVTLEKKGPQIIIEDISDFRNLERYFSRFVSPRVLERMQTDNRDFFRAGRQELTALFADLRGFTGAAEKMTPEDVKLTVDEFMHAMDEVVHQHEATLDKFVADQAVVLCGAPIPNPDHARQALRVARDMLRAQAALREEWGGSGRVALDLGVGINSGEMVVGYVGTEKRGQYTALGTGVNLAARLCEQAEPGTILLGERTRQMVGDSGWPPGLGPLEPREVLLKGISAPVKAFRTALTPVED